MIVRVFFFSASGLTRVTLFFRAKGDRLRHHFMFASALPVFRFPPSLLKPAIDNGDVSLAQVLAAMLGLLAKDHDINETHFLFLIIGLSKPPVDGQPEIGDGGPTGSVSKFRVSRQVPDENDLIESHPFRTLPVLQPPPPATLPLPHARSGI